MKDFGLVSIVTASYNSAQFIAETIESIIAQTYTNWELLMCDDASTDNTVDIIRHYVASDPRIKLFVLQQNCYSSYLECKEDNSLCGIVLCKSRYTERNICHNGSIGFSTLIYSVKNIGGVMLPSMRKRQDWALKILLIQKGGTAYGVKEPLVYYRVRSGSLSRKKRKLIKYNVQVYREILHYSWLKLWFVFLFMFAPHQIVHNCKVRLDNRKYSKTNFEMQ